MANVWVDDELWALIEPLIPVKPRRHKHPGRKPLDDRKVHTGILFVLKSGIPWEDLPQELGCGSGMTCWRRLNAWQKAGVWQQVHAVLLAKLHDADRIDWSSAVVDSSSIRALKGANTPGRTRQIGPVRAANTRQQTPPHHGCDGPSTRCWTDRRQHA